MSWHNVKVSKTLEHNISHPRKAAATKTAALSDNFGLLWRGRLDFQPFCEPAFLAPHHGWITGLPIVFLDQSQGGLLKSSRLPCDWSILSLVFPTWRQRSFVCVLERFHIEKFRETQQEVIVSLLEEKDVLVSQPTTSEKNVIFIPPRSCASSMLRR